MFFEFLISFQRRADQSQGQTLVIASTQEEARQLMDSGLQILAISEGVPRLQPNQRTFSLEEAAAYLKRAPRTIWDLQAKGLLPAPKGNGKTVFLREQLDAFLWVEQQCAAWAEKNPQMARKAEELRRAA